MKTALVYTLLLLGSLSVVCCKKDSDSIEAITAKETELVNSADPQAYLQGTFPAVYIVWPTGHSPNFEGQDWAEQPDPKAIMGNYQLIVESKGADSLRLYLDGAGTGPTFNKELLATVGYNIQSPVSNISAGYRYTQWEPTTPYLKTEWHRITIERKAFDTKTVFIYRVFVSRIGTNGPLTIHNDNRYNEMDAVGFFQFIRVSPGIIK